MAGTSKQLRDICPQDAASCAQHTKCPGRRYMTSVSGQGGHRSPAEGKTLALEWPQALRCPCWEAGMASPAHLPPRYKALSCMLQLTCSTQSCDCHGTKPHIKPDEFHSCARDDTLFCLCLSLSPPSAQQPPAATTDEARACPPARNTWGGAGFRLAMVLGETRLGLGKEKKQASMFTAP